MTRVTAQMSVSMDGFYAGPKHDTHPQRWMDGVEADGGDPAVLEQQPCSFARGIGTENAQRPRPAERLALSNSGITVMPPRPCEGVPHVTRSRP